MASRVDPIPVLKRRVADEILALLDGWTQRNAAEFLSTRQPKMSELRAGHLELFSLERLIRYLAWLGRDVTIVSTRSDRRTVLDHSVIDG